MKKAYLILGCLLASILLLGAIFIVASKPSSKVSKNTECSQLPLSVLDSERSQGLIIKDRQLLVVRLNQESNYSVPGGHVDFGESNTEALSREIYEEVGIKAKPTAFKYYKTDCVPKNDKLQRIQFYLVEEFEDQVSLKDKKDKVLWVNYEFESKKKADTDVKLALFYLKKDSLIE